MNWPAPANPGLPDRLARQSVGIADAKKVRGILKEAMLALLTELADLPNKVTILALVG